MFSRDSAFKIRARGFSRWQGWMTKISYPDYAKSNNIVHFLCNNIMTTCKGLLVLHLKFSILKLKKSIQMMK